jgi:ankyrin repeat protein
MSQPSSPNQQKPLSPQTESPSSASAEREIMTVRDAIFRQDLDALKNLLSKGHSPDAPDVSDTTPLMAAARRGWAAGVEALASRGRPGAVDKDGRNALMWAAESGDARTVEILLPLCDAAHVDGQGCSAATLALMRGNKDCARLTLPFAPQNARTANGKTPLMWAALGGDEETVGMVLACHNEEGARAAARETAKNGHTALMSAARNGNARAIRALLPVSDARQRINDASADCALTLAAMSGSLESVELLLAALPPGALDEANRQGMTAIDCALSLGHDALGEELALRLPIERQRTLLRDWTASEVELPRLSASVEKADIGGALGEPPPEGENGAQKRSLRI